MQFICYSKCSTCQKAKKWLDSNGFEVEMRDIRTQNPSRSELERFLKISGLPVRKLFNTSGNKYKELNLKDRLPEMPESEQLDLLATDGMLVKRPILAVDDLVLFGFKEDDWAVKLQKYQK